MTQLTLGNSEIPDFPEALRDLYTQEPSAWRVSRPGYPTCETDDCNHAVVEADNPNGSGKVSIQQQSGGRGVLYVLAWGDLHLPVNSTIFLLVPPGHVKAEAIATSPTKEASES